MEKCKEFWRFSLKLIHFFGRECNKDVPLQRLNDIKEYPYMVLRLKSLKVSTTFYSILTHLSICCNCFVYY